MARLDVFWIPAELDHAGPPDCAIVIDAIRATTSISTALAAGAKRVIPAGTVEAARALAAREPGALLCGERNGTAPEGFDHGNSPHEFIPERVAHRTLVFTTTNGTTAIEAVRGADDVRLACFRNAEAVAVSLASRPLADEARLAILCAGRKGRLSMDDAWCAGHLVDRIGRRMPHAILGEGARIALALARTHGAPSARALGRTDAGRALRAIGLEADLELCAATDDLSVVPVMREGSFVPGGEEEADVG